MPPCTAGLSRVTTSVCWSRLWVNKSVSFLIILSDKAHKRTLTVLISSQSGQTVSIDAKCDEPTLLGNVLDEIKQTFCPCWLCSTAPGCTWPLHAPLLAETQHNHVTKKKHCGWHFSVSHYLLVLRFARFPLWPPSSVSNILMFLCTPHSFPDISLLFHSHCVRLSFLQYDFFYFFTLWFPHLDYPWLLTLYWAPLCGCSSFSAVSVYLPALHFVSSLWQSRNVILKTGRLLLMVELCFYCFGVFFVFLFVLVCLFFFFSPSFWNLSAPLSHPLCFVILTPVCMLLDCESHVIDSLRQVPAKNNTTGTHPLFPWCLEKTRHSR